MGARYDFIDRLIRRARREVRRTDLMSGLAACVAALALILLVGVALAVLDVPPGKVRVPYRIGATLVFLATAGWFLIRPLVARLTDDAIAFRLGLQDESVGDGLVSAVQLHRDRESLADQYKVSESLINRHVEAVVEAAQALDPRRLADRDRLKRIGIYALAGVGIYGVLAFLLPTQAERGRVLLAGRTPPVATPDSERRKELGLAPQLGDFVITYNYPAYTGRPPETIPGASGNLQAIKGTVADIRLAADRDVASAKLVINGKDEIPLTIAEDGRTMRAQLTLLEDGTYEVVAEGKDGREAKSDEPHTITVEPDAVPMVEILFPPQVQVVNEMSELPVAWSASDDFGIRKAILVVEQNKDVQRIPLWTPVDDPPKHHGETYRWSLAGLELKPEQPVSYYIEVQDTDTISGPKKGRSAKHTLKVLSSEEIHAQVIALQEKLLQLMIGVLADHLEDPISVATVKSDEQVVEASERLEGRIGVLSRSLGEVLTKMLEDPLGDEAVYLALEEMRRDLETTRDEYNGRVINLRDGGIPNSASLYRMRRRTTAFVQVRDGAIEELEQDVLFLEDLIMKQRLDAAAQELSSLMDQQANLQELLDKYKRGEATDAELAQQLQEKLAEIERRMAEIAQQMASNMPQVADTFQNQAFGDDIMSQIRKAIQEGRMDDAAALTQQMLEGLKQAMQGFEQNRQRMTIDPETLAQMQAARDKLAEMRKEQQRIVKETKDLRDDIRKQMDQRTKNQIPKFVDKMLEKTEQLRREVNDMNQAAAQDPWMRGITRAETGRLEQQIGRLEEALKAHELSDSLEYAQDTESTLDRLADTAESIRSSGTAGKKTADKARKAERTADDIAKELEKLRRQFEDAATAQQRRQMQNLQQQQQQLQQQAQQMGQQLQQMSEGTPFLPSQTGQQMQQAAGAMSQAGQRLGEGNASSALPSERAADRKLGEAQEGLENAMKGGKPGQRGGQPLGQRMGGGYDTPWSRGGAVSHRPIEIPDPSQFKPPKEFREDIIDAMKKPSPEGYENLNEDYYERLVK